MERLVSIGIGLAILGIIYYHVDLFEVVKLIRGSRPVWLSLGFLMFIPIVLLPAARLKILAPAGSGVSFGEAVQLILAAASLNMVLPSKMGDLAKGYFIAGKGSVSLPTSLSLVIYEKASDLLSLLMWCAFGLLLHQDGSSLFLHLSVLVWSGLLGGLVFLISPSVSSLVFRIFIAVIPVAAGRKVSELRDSWLEMQAYMGGRRILMLETALLSITVWFMHLLQIWVFALALGGAIPLIAHLGLTPLAIFTGLMPVTFAGVGTRDAALVFFLKGYLGVAGSAALGIFCTLRYIIPALAGLPLLTRYIGLIRTRERKAAN